MHTLAVHLLPDLVDPAALADRTVVVIDVLRATTTLAFALVAGAEEIVVCGEVDEARRLATTPSTRATVLGGERQGVKLPGFDLGNSPSEYTSSSVGGKRLVFTTTNGTRAMLRCRQARRVWLAALVNRAAVVAALRGVDVAHLVCAGTRGAISGEDALVAGALVAAFVDAGGATPTLNDEAQLALALWRSTIVGHDTPTQQRAAIERAFRRALGGRNLIDEGFVADLATAAELDRFDILPRFDPATQRLLPDDRS